jgi:hypothetical protein
MSIKSFLNFLSGRFKISPLIMKDSLSGTVIWIGSYFLSVLEVHHSMLSWLQEFVVRNLLLFS